MDAPIDQFAGVKNIEKHVGPHSASLQANISTQQCLISLVVAERVLGSIDYVDSNKACQKYTNIYVI